MRQKLIILFILFFTFSYGAGKKEITLEKVVKENIFKEKDIKGLKSLADGDHYTSIDKDKKQLIKYAYQTGEAVDTLLNLKPIKKYDIKDISGYEISADGNKILFYTNKKQIYRRSYYADYYIKNRATNKIQQLTEKKNIRIADLSPDGKRVAYVHKNNIYYKDLESEQEYQITHDGEKNKIQNGTPDWVYEEEFGFNKAYAWSPDNKMIAYIRFDEREVKTFNMTLFQASHPTLEDNKLYPENYTFKYPKPGEKNSIVSVHVYHLKSKETIDMKIGNDSEQYVPRIKWFPNSRHLAIFRLNRLQNHFEILQGDPKNGRTGVIYEDKESEYVEDGTFDAVTFLRDNKRFIVMNETTGYQHLFLHHVNGKKLNAITQGEFDVQKYYGLNEEKGRVFFSAFDNSPLNVSLFSIDLDGNNLKRLTKNKGRNSADFSKNNKFFINKFSNKSTPKTVTLHNCDGELIRTLEDNQQVLDSLENYQFSEMEFFTFRTSEDVELNGWMLKPVDFDAEKQYPVLIDQYSGPGSQSVQNEWNCNWYQHFIAQDYIVVSVDPRGTGGRGEEFKKMTYMEMGKYETLDLIETAKYLQDLKYIDPERIGIWGWSYGGFTTLLAMEKGNGIFKAGVAVAPVTTWRFYDSIYTERFMRTPQENPSGYDDNSPLFFADQLQGKLLICHGSADDNVHMQNTMEFIDDLVQADKQFDMMIYTNRNHSIYGGNTRYHLMRKICDFLLENL